MLEGVETWKNIRREDGLRVGQYVECNCSFWILVKSGIVARYSDIEHSEIYAFSFLVTQKSRIRIQEKDKRRGAPWTG
jgi:hypothetical protein